MSFNQHIGVTNNPLTKDDPCWENYEMVGTKIQDGREVPNCVPKKEKDDEPVEKYNERVYFKELDKLTRRNIPTFMMSEHLTNKFGIELREAKQILQRYMRNQKKDDESVEKRRWPRLGRIIMTRGVADKMNPEYWGNTPAGKNRANKFKRDVQRAMAQYKRGDWGMSGREDSKLNDASVEEGSRILAVYNTVEGKIWIITERGHSRTTILFPSEY